MENIQNIHATESHEIGIDAIKKAADHLYNKKEKPLPKGIGWFTKLMARFGWHREYQVIVIDKERLKKLAWDDRAKNL